MSYAVKIVQSDGSGNYLLNGVGAVMKFSNQDAAQRQADFMKSAGGLQTIEAVEYPEPGLKGEAP